MVQVTSQLLLGKRYHGLMRRMKLKCKVRPSPKPEMSEFCELKKKRDPTLPPVGWGRISLLSRAHLLE